MSESDGDGDGRTRILLWSGDGPLQQTSTLEDAVDRFGRDDGLRLVVLVESHADEALHVLQRPLHLHPLAVEDALSGSERSKLDRYTDHLYLDVRRPLDERTTMELGVFAGDRSLVAVLKKGPADWPDEVLDGSDRHGIGLGDGVGGVLHALLDAVVDDQIARAEALQRETTRLEDAVLDPSGEGTLHLQAYSLRKRVDAARSVTAPSAEILRQLLDSPDDDGLVTGRLRPYFADVADHAQHAAEIVDTSRQDVDGLMQTDLSQQSNDLSRTSKLLTAWAAIVAVPTLVTGYFGQNVRFPGTGTVVGALVSAGLVVVPAVLLYLLFRRKGWVT